jgi:hypothetical protein
MKRLLVLGTLLGALSVTAALVSSSASAVTTARLTTPANIGGVVPVRGKQFPGAGLPLINHGGPTMTTNKTYTIFWKPAGYTMATGYDTTINQYFQDVAHDSGMGTNVYASDTQYSGIQYSSTYGGTFTDTNPFPASGCPLYNGLPVCLTDDQLQTEVNNVIASQGWTKNGTNMFFMFTAKNVGSCFDSSGSTCAFTYYCAYHGSTNSGAAIYANMPYVGGVGGCDQGEYPNGASNQADPTLNVTSHEHNEAITDPQLNAWYDAQGNENGDKCAWNFGAVQGPAGGEYNQTINGHHYFLQQEWSNSNPSLTCVQTYNIGGGGGGGGVPKITSFTPSSGKRGVTTVTINGSNLTGATWVGLVHGVATYKSSTWTVVSSSKITTTVPSNAPTGFSKWKVTTPGGSATSFSYFSVTG